ncbi:MAG: phosphate ABC transporter substrate-binding protein [Ignavibacteriae bacterium]|nr:MAG: phosphate ABC transporter substrate-binding protein [Ignavibacteriota bacterium]
MKKLTITFILLFAVILSASIVGCGRKQNNSVNKKSITIKGSDTMVHLMSTLAEEFMKKTPGAQVSITGGGSGTGIAALLNGTTDICASSRDMQEKEKKQAQEKNINPVEKTIAYDGIAIVVHPENPVKEFTLEQIKKIYTGAYTNWKEVGGPDQPISILSRESNSGTYVFFQEHVLNKEDYAKSVRLMSASSAIIQTVTEDKWSIGYVGLGYTKDAKVKILPVKKDANSPAVSASHETVLNKTYSIARPLYLYFNGEPTGNSKIFLEFCESPEGQKIVEETGYITLK